MIRSLLAIPALGAAFIGTAVAAQTEVDTGDESYNMVIVYGDDACPPSEDGTIVVCARQAESERYRIPSNLRFTDGPQSQSWMERVERLEWVGKSGMQSCSPAGSGGFVGCTQKFIDEAYADREDASSVRFSEIIAAQRAERLSTIDADAERTQAEVEAIERDYMERLERERDGAVPGEEELPQLESEGPVGPADEQADDRSGDQQEDPGI